jgi:hypothetical protein
MKTHTHYTIPTATTPWMRRNVSALAALLAAMAAVVGLVFALGRFGLMTPNLIGGAAISPAHPPISTCRACADEMLGAAQASQASLTHQAIDSAATPRLASPRAFRDDMLGAEQANLAFVSIDAARQPSQMSAPSARAVHQQLTSPRAFRDDALGAEQANLAWLSARGSDLNQLQDGTQRAGPR